VVVVVVVVFVVIVDFNPIGRSPLGDSLTKKLAISNETSISSKVCFLFVILVISALILIL
jgi:hypothetical protein